MKTELKEFEGDECLGEKLTSSGFSGLTLAYAVSVVEGEVVTLCEYSVTPVITLGPKEDPRETRAYREMLRRGGKKLPKIEENALRDELVILPGAAMSPADVVKALKRFIKHVQRDGMNIGCQSAFKFDPVSASNFDPFERRVLTLALVSSELAGIAETRRARV